MRSETPACRPDDVADWYDRQAIKAEMVALSRPRGASDLARAVGVSAQSATRWGNPDYPDVPTPEKWPAIEAHYGLKSGHLAKTAGLRSQPPAESSVAQLGRRVDQLADEVAELRRVLAQITNSASYTLAANMGDTGAGREGSAYGGGRFAPAEGDDPEGGA